MKGEPVCTEFGKARDRLDDIERSLVGPPNGSEPLWPTVQRPKENLSSRVGGVVTERIRQHPLVFVVQGKILVLVLAGARVAISITPVGAPSSVATVGTDRR